MVVDRRSVVETEESSADTLQLESERLVERDRALIVGANAQFDTVNCGVGMVSPRQESHQQSTANAAPLPLGMDGDVDSGDVPDAVLSAASDGRLRDESPVEFGDERAALAVARHAAGSLVGRHRANLARGEHDAVARLVHCDVQRVEGLRIAGREQAYVQHLVCASRPMGIRHAMTLSCPGCGGVCEAGASFCSACGTALRPATDAAGQHGGWDTVVAAMHAPTQPASTMVVNRMASPFSRRDLAGLWRRLGAGVLDGLCQLVIVVVIAGLCVLAVYLYSPDIFDADVWGDLAGDEQTFVIAEVIMGFVALLVFGLVWEVLWLRSRLLAKPGQAAMGFRVTDQLGMRMSRGQAFGRWASKLLYGLPYVGSALYVACVLTIGISRRRQAIHDMLANVVCVRTSALRHQPRATSAPSSLANAAGDRAPVSRSSVR